MKASMKWPVVAAVVGFIAVAAVYSWATLSPFSRATVEVPVPGGTYIEGLVGQPKYLNPILSQPDTVDQDIVALVFSGLSKVSDDGAIVPDLARSWDISTDGKTYLFDLRPGARWHDGWPVVADDVVYTVRQVQDPAYQGNPAFAGLWQGISVEKVSDSRVKFVLKDAYAPFLEFTTLGLLPSHLLSNVPAQRLPESTFNLRPVGTGPFRVVDSGLQEVGLDPFPDYYGAKPMLDKIRFRFYADERSALRALRLQEVLGVGYVGPQDLEKLREDQSVVTYVSPEYSKLTLLILNTKSAVIVDAAMRQAIAYSLSRDRIIELAMDGAAVPAEGLTIPGSWAAGKGRGGYNYDPEKAKALLDEAGWKDSDGDGIREKGNDKLSFILLTNDKPQRVAAAQEISRQLAEVGVKVDAQSTGWSGFVQDFLVPRFFHAVLAEQWSPGADPDGYQFWHSSQARNGLNFSQWTNRTADELIENGRKTAQPADRAKYYADFEKLFAKEVPGIPLYYPLYTYVINRNIKGVQLGLMIDPSHRFDHIDQWYIRTKKVEVDAKGTPVGK